ncbi:MAG: hypothetical protein ABSG13_15540 [Bryobacteraceae bacterium]|jgi:hypothetical protein
MAILSLLNQANGPLPISAKFNAPSDAPSCFVLSGSVWSQTKDQLIGVGLELEGKAVGSAAIFSNGPSTHRAVVPSYIPVTLTFGPHTVTLVALNSSTTSDKNDFFDVALQYCVVSM